LTFTKNPFFPRVVGSALIPLRASPDAVWGRSRGAENWQG